MPDITRRTFIRTAAAAGATVALGKIALSAPGTEDRGAGMPPSPSWTDKPMRWAQLTLVENDPGSFSPQFWFDYFRRTHSDAVCLSAGGCVAYYPTAIPYHHRSAWLGDRDTFGELVEGCRKQGMVVVARTDPHATYDEVKEAHPDWIAVGPDGKPRRHWATPELWLTCALGPYNFEFMTDVKREIMTRYRVDGIFINRWDGSGPCYCEHCRANFKAESGLDLPRSDSPGDPARRAYVVWRQERLFSLWRLWDEQVRSINPDSCVIPNTGGGATSPLDMKRIGEIAPTLMADRQSRRGVAAPWANGKNGKEYRATMGSKPIVGIFSVGVDDDHRWKDSVQSPDEIRLWAVDGIANGLRPWFTKFGGVIYDPRWLKPVEDLYAWCHRSERYLRNEAPIARVAMVYSQQTGWFYDGKAGVADGIDGAALGWYQALVESRIPFEMVHDRLLDADRLAGFRTLILPNIALLSDRQCAQLRQFVAGGGSLVATSETSLYDEWGKPRADFGLGDLFGAKWKGQIEGPMRNAYVRLEHGREPAHPLFRGLEDAPRIINGVWRVDADSIEAAPKSLLTLIPSYPDLPMEEVYPRVPHTDIPAVFMSERPSRGRVVYFPWDVDRTFWEVLSPDHGTLLRNAVEWANQEPPPVTVEGPGVLDVTLWRQKHSLTVHMVNLSNPMMMKGPVRHLMPVGAQRVRVLVPDGLRAKRVRLLVAESAPDFTQSGAAVEFVVPSIEAHEVAAIDV